MREFGVMEGMKLEHSHGLIKVNLLENLIIITSNKVNIHGQMRELMMDHGKTTECMVLEYSRGKTGKNMKEVLQTISNLDMEPLNGLIKEFMKDNGEMTSNMVSENIHLQTKRQK